MAERAYRDDTPFLYLGTTRLALSTNKDYIITP